MADAIRRPPMSGEAIRRLVHVPPLRWVPHDRVKRPDRSDSCFAPPRPTHGRWAACEGRSPGSRLERFLRPSRTCWGQTRRVQWHVRSQLAAYSCGGSHGIEGLPRHQRGHRRTAFPFHFGHPRAIRRPSQATLTHGHLWSVNDLIGQHLRQRFADEVGEAGAF